jgi:hypothetical protein
MACTAALPAVSREQLRATIAGKCQQQIKMLL